MLCITFPGCWFLIWLGQLPLPWALGNICGKSLPQQFLPHCRVDTGKVPPGSVFSTIHSFHLLNQGCFWESRLKHHSSRLASPDDHTSSKLQEYAHIWFNLPIPSFSWHLCPSPGTRSFSVCVDSDRINQRSGTDYRNGNSYTIKNGR